ncbi:MAG: recombinase RarA, partial [Treponema sp.]|nr:recombinase RarA [Treponema sp.]
LAYFDALKEVEREDAETPNHLRDASRDAEGFGHGEGYIYPHAYRDHWAAQQYLPNSLKGRTFYIPSSIGYEGKIRDDVLQKRELQAAIILNSQKEDNEEILSWSAASKGREGWFKRLESGRSRLLLNDRNIIFDAASPKRHDRVLIPMANDGLLLWESLRKCPEGLSAGIVSNSEAKQALINYSSVLNETEKPLIAVADEIIPAIAQCEEWFSCSKFDHILLRTIRLSLDLSAINGKIKPLLAKNGKIVIFTSLPRHGERLSRILDAECEKPDLAVKLKEAEDQFFSSSNLNSGFNEINDLIKSFDEQDFNVNAREIDQKEERLITEKDISLWFDAQKSRWGSFIANCIEKNAFSAMEDALRTRFLKGPVLWQWKSVCLTAVLK